MEHRDRMCLTCVSQRQQHPGELRSEGKLQTDGGKIDKIVLQISHYQHVSNVCGDVRFHTQRAAEAETQARAPHFYSSITVTKEERERERERK